MSIPVSVLFARRDSIYKQLPSVDVWDEDRDARNWPGGTPVVAHPPCAGYCRLRAFANEDAERDSHAIWAVEQVRKFGGVLEHPYLSTLWKLDDLKLPVPGEFDQWDGYTVAMPQFWFGFPAMKATWFYIVGCRPSNLPPVPLRLGKPEVIVSTTASGNSREMKKSERTVTVRPLAEWLVDVARRTAA